MLSLPVKNNTFIENDLPVGQAINNGGKKLCRPVYSVAKNAEVQVAVKLCDATGAQ